MNVKDTLDSLGEGLRSSALSAPGRCLVSSSVGLTLPLVDASAQRHLSHGSETAAEVEKKSASKIPYLLITAIKKKKDPICIQIRTKQ